MTGKTYLRPTGFVDAPFGHDGKVARLAGGLLFFSMVELVREDGTELVPVARIEDRLDEAGRVVWQRLTAPRAPLQLGERVVRLDQPQVMGILNVTPDSFSDGGGMTRPRRRSRRATTWRRPARRSSTSAANPPGPARSRSGKATRWRACCR